MSKMVDRAVSAMAMRMRLEFDGDVRLCELTVGEMSRLARAVIEAMREPTEAMLDAALSVASWEYELDERKEASVYWPAMIDEALKD